MANNGLTGLTLLSALKIDEFEEDEIHLVFGVLYFVFCLLSLM
jgi:hypothetical protein